MEGTKEPSTLYFSLLPGHLNRYFREHYLPYECERIWSILYSGRDARKNDFIDPTLILGIEFLTYAAKNGYTKLLKYVHERNEIAIEKYTVVLYNYAAAGNHVETLKWLYEEFKAAIPDLIIQSATDNGSLDILKYIYAIKGPFLKDVWNRAAEKGHIHILQWLVDNNLGIIHGWIYNKYEGAIKGGRIEVIQWIRNTGFQWEKDILRLAMKHKQYTVATWLLASDCPINRTEALEAAIIIEASKNPLV